MQNISILTGMDFLIRRDTKISYAALRYLDLLIKACKGEINPKAE